MSDEKKYSSRGATAYGGAGGLRGPQRATGARTSASGESDTGRRARVGERSYAPAEGGGEQIAPRIRKKRTGRTPLRKIHAKKNKAPDTAAAKAAAERVAAGKIAAAAGDAAAEATVVQGGLNGKQRRYLRGLGHELDAIVQVGKEGTTEGVVAACAVALSQHELVKVKIQKECPEDRHAVAETLARGTGGALVQVLGRTVLVYKRHPKEPKIRLPL